MSEMLTISDILLKTLINEGCDTIFGVPGDYTIGLNIEIEKLRATTSKGKIHDAKCISFVNTCGEECAGFAADAYARISGIGCCLTTFNVGSLKLLNAAACCAAERVPVAFIVGTPGVEERLGDIWMHHGWGKNSYEVPTNTFSEFVCAHTSLTDPNTAQYEVSRVLKAAKVQQRPVFIELPRDCCNKSSLSSKSISPRMALLPPSLEIDCSGLSQLINLLCDAESVAIIAGVEVLRFHMQTHVVHFAEALLAHQMKSGLGSRATSRARVAIATTVLGKAAFETNTAFEEPDGYVDDEEAIQYVGTYAGSVANPVARESVELADVIIILGDMPADINFRLMGSALLDSRRKECSNNVGAAETCPAAVVHIYDCEVRVLRSATSELTFSYSSLQELIDKLAKGIDDRRLSSQSTNQSSIQSRKRGISRAPSGGHRKDAKTYHPDDSIRMDSLFGLLGELLQATSCALSAENGRPTTIVEESALVSTQPLMVIADTGDALFGSIGLPVPRGMQGCYLAPYFYLTMGWAIPAALGAFYAAPSRRPVVLEGDGCFQMASNEISCLLRCGSNAIILLINNNGYQTQRQMADGAFANLSAWNYTALCRAYATAPSCDPNINAEDKLYSQRVYTVDQCVKALRLALSAEYVQKLVFLEILVPAGDKSSVLQAITNTMREDVNTCASR